MSVTAPRPDQRATRLARSASALMLVSAATSAYWSAGGTGLLNTVGGSIARWGRDGGADVRLALAAIVVLKLVAAWLQAAVLTVYGGVLTGTGLAVQAGVLHTGADPDWKALDWHAYLWDPWFLIVGLLVWAALRRSMKRVGATGTRIRHSA